MSTDYSAAAPISLDPPRFGAVPQQPGRTVAVWLFAVCAMILVMIGLGGATRLTGSGLSIMEWAPFRGALPPVTDAEWQRLFKLYQQIPQYALVKRQMHKPGSVFSFEIDGGRPEAHAILDALELIDISNNIGDAKTLMTHPASTTHSSLTPEVRAEMGVGENMLRISVGLEDVQDLIEDLDAALGKVGL